MVSVVGRRFCLAVWLVPASVCDSLSRCLTTNTFVSPPLAFSHAARSSQIDFIMSFKPGKLINALTKVMPDVGIDLVFALKAALLHKDAVSLTEAVTLLTEFGIPTDEVFDVREELEGLPPTDAATAARLFKPGKVVAALKKVIPDVSTATLSALKADVMSKESVSLSDVATLLTGLGVSPAYAFDVREELDSMPVDASSASGTPPREVMHVSVERHHALSVRIVDALFLARAHAAVLARVTYARARADLCM
jgi:hypothetical protein